MITISMIRKGVDTDASNNIMIQIVATDVASKAEREEYLLRKADIIHVVRKTKPINQ